MITKINAVLSTIQMSAVSRFFLWLGIALMLYSYISGYYWITFVSIFFILTGSIIWYLYGRKNKLPAYIKKYLNKK